MHITVYEGSVQGMPLHLDVLSIGGFFLWLISSRIRQDKRTREKRLLSKIGANHRSMTCKLELVRSELTGFDERPSFPICFDVPNGNYWNSIRYKHS